MKTDKEKIREEIYRIRHKGTISYKPETGDVSGPGDISHFPPTTQAVIEITKDKLEKGVFSEPTDYEQELAGEQSICWENYEKEIFKVVDHFSNNKIENLFVVFERLALSLNDLWSAAFFDWEAQTVIFKLLEDINPELFKKYKNQLWFCMYHYSEVNIRMEILTRGIGYNFSKDFPYPGFYQNELEPGEEY